MSTTELPLVASRPAEVIDLRRELLEFWSRDGKLQRAFAMQGRRKLADAPTSLTPERQGAAARAWFADTLQRAEMYWVSPEMVDVLAAVAPSIPDAVPRPPVPEALVVFAKPLAGIDADTGITIHTAAYMWGPVILLKVPCFSIDTFGWREFIHPMNLNPAEEERWRSAIPTKLVNTGGAEWPVDMPTSDMIFVEPASVQMSASIVEDRRVMSAFWALCAQHITTESLDPGDRPTRRRAERAGITNLNPVRVIRLRETARSGGGDGSAVDYSHRWIVGAHWRNQPYGPHSSLRRPQLIPAHVKGPKDKPLVVRETVRALVR